MFAGGMPKLPSKTALPTAGARPAPPSGGGAAPARPTPGGGGFNPFAGGEYSNLKFSLFQIIILTLFFLPRCTCKTFPSSYPTPSINTTFCQSTTSNSYSSCRSKTCGTTCCYTSCKRTSSCCSTTNCFSTFTRRTRYLQHTISIRPRF